MELILIFVQTLIHLMKQNSHDSDEILKRLFEPKPIKVKETLSELFLNRLESLEIPKTTALNLMGMSARSLDGIITGEQKMIDYTQLVKLSNFLGVQLDEVVNLYLEKVQEVHASDLNDVVSGELVKFINEKFDLAELRKVGLIKTLTDYTEINNSICNYFGLRSIFEYKEPNISIAFSAGKRAKSNCSLNNWIYLAEQKCIELRNPNIYNRENLIEYFPNIRWQSMDVENGLIKVIKQLFNIGITVVIVPSFPSVHVRGATFTINDKPCIALTDYVGFYPTLWFGLIHELYHVLFDWEDIKNSDPHISEELGLDSISPLEKAADDFAREYLFSKSKTIESSLFINNENLVRSYALNNNIDPSFVYVFNAYDAPKTDKYAWGRAKKHNPDIKKLKSKLQHDFENGTSFSDHIKKIRNTIYS